MHSQQPPQQSGDQRRSGFNALAFVVHTLATSLVVFLRKDFGHRFLGLQAAAVLVAVPLFAAAWPNHDLQPLFLFLLAYLGACLIARIDIARRARRGGQEHSYYSGRPRLAALLPRIDERTLKRGVEPLVAILGGVLLMPWNEPLGVYVFIAGWALLFSGGIVQQLEQHRSQQLYDAYLEQQYVSGRFRQMRGDRM